MVMLFLYYQVIYFDPPLLGLPWLVIWGGLLTLSVLTAKLNYRLIPLLLIPFVVWAFLGFHMSFGYVPRIAYYNDLSTNSFEIGTWVYFVLVGVILTKGQKLFTMPSHIISLSYHDIMSREVLMAGWKFFRKHPGISIITLAALIALGLGSL